MDTEKESLVHCRELIEQALNWGPSSHWSNLDFDNLSEKILEKTQERLSVSTLKRIWGKVRYDSSPTLATLNVLARFLDYENWRDFHFRIGVQGHSSSSAVHDSAKAVHGPRSTVHGHAEVGYDRKSTDTGSAVDRSGVDRGHTGSEVKPEVYRHMKLENPNTFRADRRRMRLIGGAVVAVLVGIFAILFVRGKTPAVNESGVVFESRKVSDDLPNSVVFTYNIGNLPADSVFIQQSWDPKRRDRVSPAGTHHTSIYYRPGYFRAKLIVNDKIKKEDIVFIKTQGWKGIIDGEGTSPVYLSEAEVRQPGGMGIDHSTLRDKIGSPVFTNHWTVFHNVHEFDDLDHQNFTFETSLRNTSTVEECLCRKVSITLLQKGNAIMIPLTTPGCISDINVFTPARSLIGKKEDLSAFGCNFSDFVQVRCQAAAGIFSISLNGSVVLEEKITTPLNELVGIRIGFEGTGEIEYVTLSSSGKTILEDNFRTPL